MKGTPEGKANTERLAQLEGSFIHKLWGWKKELIECVRTMDVGATAQDCLNRAADVGFIPPPSVPSKGEYEKSKPNGTKTIIFIALVPLLTLTRCFRCLEEIHRHARKNGRSDVPIFCSTGRAIEKRCCKNIDHCTCAGSCHRSGQKQDVQIS